MTRKATKAKIETAVIAAEDTAVSAPVSQPTLTAWKGFYRDLKCRGFQYVVGETYRAAGKIVRCTEHGFHSCEMPLDIWSYYGPADSRYAEVLAGGSIARGDAGDDSKFASAEITIKAEIKLPALISAAVEWIIARAKTNIATGDGGHAAATGYRGHAAATGDGGHAAATGFGGHAAATGDGGHAAATGDGGHAAATGDGGHAAATGFGGHAAATGKCGHAAATGDGGHAAAMDFGGHAAATGECAIAVALGPNSTALAGDGGWIVLAAWRWNGDRYDLLQVRAAKVGGSEGIKAGARYQLTEAGEFKEIV